MKKKNCLIIKCFLNKQIKQKLCPWAIAINMRKHTLLEAGSQQYQWSTVQSFLLNFAFLPNKMQDLHLESIQINFSKTTYKQRNITKKKNLIITVSFLTIASEQVEISFCVSIFSKVLSFNFYIEVYKLILKTTSQPFTFFN